MFEHMAARIFDTPLAIEPGRAAVIARAIAPRLLGGRATIAPWTAGTRLSDVDLAQPRGEASILGDEIGEEFRGGRRTVRVREGVAVIPVIGTLVQRAGQMSPDSTPLLSYETVAAALRTAAADSAVRGIALEIDSFGGEVAGLFDLADEIRAVGAEKPVRAFLADFAFSAAYAIAAQAGRITVPRTGGAGSIGVIGLHVDESRALDAEGVTVTIIKAGAKKADGNPFEPLAEEVRAEIQAEFEAIRGLFARTVAAGRAGRMTAEAALATEAGVFRGQAAVDAGLADEVASPREAFEAFVDDLRNPGGIRARAAAAAEPAIHRQQPQEADMTDTPKDGAGSNAAPATEPKSPATLAELRAEHPALVAEAEQAAAAAERSRIQECQAALVDGCGDAIAAMAFDGKSRAGDVALAVVKAAKARGDAHLAALKGAEGEMQAAGLAAAPVATGGVTEPNAATPDGWRAEYGKTQALQAEFGTAEAYVAFKKAEAAGRVRVLKNAKED